MTCKSRRRRVTAGLRCQRPQTDGQFAPFRKARAQSTRWRSAGRIPVWYLQIRKGVVRIHNLKTGDLLQEIAAHNSEGGCRCVAVSPDDRRLLTSGNDGQIKLWDVRTGELLRTYKDVEKPVPQVAWAHDGRTFLAGLAVAGGRLVHWDVETGEQVRTLGGGFKFAWSRDGRHVLTRSFDNTLIFRDLTTGKVLSEHAGHGAQIRTVALSADGKHAISASDDGTFRLWCLKQQRCLRVYSGRKTRLLTFTSDAARIIAAESGNTVSIWETGRGGTERPVFCLPPDTEQLAQTEQRLRHELAELNSLVQTCPQEACERTSRLLEELRQPFHPGLLGVLHTAGRRGRALTVHRGVERGALPTTNCRVKSVAFSPDGTTLARSASGSIQTVEHWTSLHSASASTVLKTSFRELVGFLPNGEHFITTSENQAVLQAADSGDIVREFVGHNVSITAAALSTDGRHLLTLARAWEGKDNAPPPAARLWDVAFAPDTSSAYIALLSDQLTCWNLRTGEFLPWNVGRAIR